MSSIQYSVFYSMEFFYARKIDANNSLLNVRTIVSDANVILGVDWNNDGMFFFHRDCFTVYKLIIEKN